MFMNEDVVVPQPNQGGGDVTPPGTPRDNYRLPPPHEIELEEKDDVIVSLDDENAIIGTCTTMCPDDELEKTHAKHPIFTSSDFSPDDFDFSKAVKKYSRSDAGKERTGDLVRTPECLYNTTMYLLQEVMGQEGKTKQWSSSDSQPRLIRFRDIFSYLRDRLRSVRSDFKGVTSLYSVRCLEYTARFHIMAGHLLCGLPGTEGFDPKGNRDMLDDALIDMLWQRYDKFRLKYRDKTTGIPIEGVPVLKHISEFAAYRLLYKELKQNDDHKKWRESTTLPGCSPDPFPKSKIALPGTDLRGTDAELTALATMPEVLKSKEFLFAMRVIAAYTSSNWSAFFQLAKRAPYLQACLIASVFPFARTAYLGQLLKSTQGSLTYEWLRDTLLFDTIEELKLFISVLNIDTGDEVFNPDKKKRFVEPPIEAYKLRRPSGVVESRRKNRSNLSVCLGIEESWPDIEDTEETSTAVRLPEYKEFTYPKLKIPEDDMSLRSADEIKLMVQNAQPHIPVPVAKPEAPQVFTAPPVVKEPEPKPKPPPKLATDNPFAKGTAPEKSTFPPPSVAEWPPKSDKEEKAVTNPFALKVKSPLTKAPEPEKVEPPRKESITKEPDVVEEVTPPPLPPSPETEAEEEPEPPEVQVPPPVLSPVKASPVVRPQPVVQEVATPAPTESSVARVLSPPGTPVLSTSQASAIALEEITERDDIAKERKSFVDCLFSVFSDELRVLEKLQNFYRSGGVIKALSESFKKILRSPEEFRKAVVSQPPSGPTFAEERDSVYFYEEPIVLDQHQGVTPACIDKLKTLGDCSREVAQAVWRGYPQTDHRICLVEDNKLLANHVAANVVWSALGGQVGKTRTVRSFRSVDETQRVSLQYWKVDAIRAHTLPCYANTLVFVCATDDYDAFAEKVVEETALATSCHVVQGVPCDLGVMVFGFGKNAAATEAALHTACYRAFDSAQLVFVPLSVCVPSEGFSPSTLVAHMKESIAQKSSFSTVVPLHSLVCDAAYALSSVPNVATSPFAQCSLVDSKGLSHEEVFVRNILERVNLVLDSLADALDNSGMLQVQTPPKHAERVLCNLWRDAQLSSEYIDSTLLRRGSLASDAVHEQLKLVPSLPQGTTHPQSDNTFESLVSSLKNVAKSTLQRTASQQGDSLTDVVMRSVASAVDFCKRRTKEHCQTLPKDIPPPPFPVGSLVLTCCKALLVQLDCHAVSIACPVIALPSLRTLIQSSVRTQVACAERQILPTKLQLPLVDVIVEECVQEVKSMSLKRKVTISVPDLPDKGVPLSLALVSGAKRQKVSSPKDVSVVLSDNLKNKIRKAEQLLSEPEQKIPWQSGPPIRKAFLQATKDETFWVPSSDDIACLLQRAGQKRPRYIPVESEDILNDNSRMISFDDDISGSSSIASDLPVTYGLSFEEAEKRVLAMFEHRKRAKHP